MSDALPPDAVPWHACHATGLFDLGPGLRISFSQLKTWIGNVHNACSSQAIVLAGSETTDLGRALLGLVPRIVTFRGCSLEDVHRFVRCPRCWAGVLVVSIVGCET
jgi:hypothetical protein